MSQFFTDLWESVFISGPTPTLLAATNATFAALQVVLLGLLVATHSLHFVVLSFLSGGLWWAINWFATEMKAVQESEEREKRKREAEAALVDADNEAEEGEEEESSEAEETEVETVGGSRPATATASGGVGAGGASREVEPVQRKGELKRRAAEEVTVAADQSGGSRSGVSTEDEWEKVSENEKDK